MTVPSPIIRATLVSLFLFAAAAEASDKVGRLDDLAETVQSLLQAHQRIGKETGEIQADEIQRYNNANALLEQGRGLLVVGKTAEARVSLQMAYQLATDLVIHDRSGQTLATGRSDQYTTGPVRDRNEALVLARIESVRSLTDAYRRIAEEKRLAPSPQLETIQRGIEAAHSALLLGRHDEALRQINSAYELSSAVVVGARQGDTLIKTLAFESPAEEYRYELDRHASYKMLLQLAMAESDVSLGLRRIIERLEIDAALLEEVAEAEARSGRFADAVKSLEGSSGHLLQAIRASGRFVPG